MGPSLNLSDEELDRLAEITEADIIATQREWERAVERWAVNLLLVKESTDGSK